jgi:hypothetical protein
VSIVSEPVADAPPASDQLTDYDRAHFKTYIRLLDASAVQADWREVATIVLGLGPEIDRDRAERVYEAHLLRARWMTTTGYRELLSSKSAQ